MADSTLVSQLNQANSDLDSLNSQYSDSQSNETRIYANYNSCATFANGDPGVLDDCWQGKINGNANYKSMYISAQQNSANILTSIGLKKAQISQIEQSINSDPVAKQELDAQQSSESIKKTITYTILGIIVFVVIVFVVKKYLIK